MRLRSDERSGSRALAWLGASCLMAGLSSCGDGAAWEVGRDGSGIEASVARGAPAAVYTVTNTNDSGAGSLRDAIQKASQGPAGSTVAFDIPGTGPHTITLSSQLDARNAVTLDGCTQPGADCSIWPPTLPIVLRCSTSSGSAIDMGGGPNAVRGLVSIGMLTALRRRPSRQSATH